LPPGWKTSPGADWKPCRCRTSGSRSSMPMRTAWPIRKASGACSGTAPSEVRISGPMKKCFGSGRSSSRASATCLKTAGVERPCRRLQRVARRGACGGRGGTGGDDPCHRGRGGPPVGSNAFAQGHGGEVPRPERWGGYLLEPETIELWQHRDDRLHERYRYTRAREGWRVERLAP